MATSAAAAGVVPEKTLGLLELTPHLMCPLCGGYYIDATAIVECLHTFCRSCILRHLRNTRRCPVTGCDVLVQKAQGASAASLRPDTTLQSVVYKTVPGLHRDEMRRRQLFYADKPDSAADLPPGSKGLEEDGGAHFYDANDTIDLRIQYASQRPGDVVPMRYLRCPAGLPLSALRKFLHRKYRLSENLQMELLHGDRRLPSDVKLLDVAYIVNWDREAPLELLFRLHKSRPTVKRSAVVLPQESDRRSKVSKVDLTDASASLGQGSKREKPSSNQIVETKPAKAVAEAVPDSIGERRFDKADMKRSVSNGSCGVEGSIKSLGHDAHEKSGSVSMTSNKNNKGESAKVASPLCGIRAVKHSPTVSIERIDRKRKMGAASTIRKDIAEDTVVTPKPNKISKTTLPTSEQRQKSFIKPKPGSSTSIQRGDSMPMLSVDDVGSSGKADGRSGPVINLSPKDTGIKTKSSTNYPGQLAERRQIHSTPGAGCERMGQERKITVKQRSIASEDSNANTLKHVEKIHRQRELEKKVPKHQGLGTKERLAKATDGATTAHKQQTHQKKTNDAHVKEVASQKPCNKDGRYSGTALKSPINQANRPSSAKSNNAKLTMPLQSVKTKQTQGKSPKTTSHGTNTLLSSSPQITKSQTSSSSSTVQRTLKPAATSLCSSPGEAPKADTSKRCSPSLPKTTSVPEGQSSASKTIFLFSGSKKPQNSNRIMSIVESLTQKSLLSSLAKKGSTVKNTIQPVKQTNSANGTPRSNSSAVSKTPSVSTNGTFVAPSPLPVRSTAATPVRPVCSPLHIDTSSLGLRYGSAVPPLSGLSRPAPSSTISTTSSSRPVFPVPPLPQRPKSQSVRSIPNPSLVRQRSAEERARDCGKGSPTAGSTAPAMSPPTIRDIHSLTRQLQEAGTSVTITNTTC